MKSLNIIFLLLLSAFGYQLQAQSGRRTENFNDNWTFYLGDDPGAASDCPMIGVLNCPSIPQVLQA
jgi:hypothetical protein